MAQLAAAIPLHDRPGTSDRPYEHDDALASVLDLPVRIAFLGKEALGREESPQMTMGHGIRSDRIDRASYLAIIILAGIWGASRVASSGDLWIALGCGKYILSYGVTRTDPFSFNSPPGSWVNQNWLSHVLFTLIQGGAGLTGLGLWKFIVSIAIGGLAASTARALGAPRAFAALTAIAMAAMGRPFYDIRPNIHTILLSAALIRWLVGIEWRAAKRYWPVVLLFVLWANLHGGFLFGIMALFAAAGAVAVIRMSRRGEAARWPAVILLPFIGLAATIISPYGVTNLAHPYVITVGPDSAYWRQVVEWMPPYGPSAVGDAGVTAFWILTGAGLLIAGLAVARALKKSEPHDGTRPPGSPSLLPLGTIALAGLVLSLTSRRFIPLFSVAAAPVLAVLVARIVPGGLFGGARTPADAGALDRRIPLGRLNEQGAGLAGAPTRAPRNARDRADRTLPRRGARDLVWPLSAGAAIVAVGLSVVPSLFLGNSLWPSSLGFGARLVRADEQPSEAARFLTTSGACGRVLTQWVWGGYLLYAEPFENGEPRFRIYMDGRAQAAYPAAVSKDLSAFRHAADAEDESAVRAFLDHYKIDFCVIDRREEGVASFLPKIDGWVGVYADDKSIVMARAPRVRDLAGGEFPNLAIREASAALALRTRGTLTAMELREAFAHAVASVRARPTTTGITEMTRIALAVQTAIGDTLRAEADRECAAALASTQLVGTPREMLSIRANTIRCRAALAQASGDRDAASRMNSEAVALAEEAKRIVKLYLR